MKSKRCCGDAAGGKRLHCLTTILAAIAAIAALLVIPAPSALAGPFSTTVNIPVCPGLSVTGFIGDFPASGSTAGQMRQFLGLPYAAPPTGANRWNPPQPPPCPAAGNYTLTPTFAPHCAQLRSDAGNATENEDCLFFNVFTPVEAGTYPVMVWIHGGTLTVGESDDYNPIELVKHGIIVVTFNYRLGALGFLAHPALDNTSSGNTGNYGIQDQQALLALVKQEIATFGGDPKRVTVFGQSAGGLSTLIHMVSPKSKGLFQRAIVESGAFGLTGEPPLTGADSAESAGEAFATAAGCTLTGAAEAACLRGLSVATILANQNALYNPYFEGPAPNVDGVVLTNTIESVLQSREFNKVPLIDGSNHNEFRSFIPTIPGFGTLNLATGNFTDNVAPNTAKFPGAVTYTQALIDIGAPALILNQVELEYPGGSSDKSANAALAQAATDEAFACHALVADRLVSTAGVPVFAYELNDEKAPNSLLGTITTQDGKNFPYRAFHGAELQFLFRVSNPTGVGFNLPKKLLSGAETALSTTMVTYWATFAKTGNPNPTPKLSSVPNWPAFTATGQEILSLVPPTPSTETSFNTVHHCSFWNSLPAPTSGQIRASPRFEIPRQAPSR